MSDISLSALVESKPFRLEKSGKSICVVKVGQEVFAIDDTCSHSDASLSEGDVSKFEVECWLHGAAFDVRTGKAVSMPATQDVNTYAVHVDGDSVTIEI